MNEYFAKFLGTNLQVFPMHNPTVLQSLKILKSEFNFQKTIGTSTITEKPPGGEGGDKLPVSPFFNSVEAGEGGRQERGMEDGARRSEADFPVFDAVPS